MPSITIRDTLNVEIVSANPNVTSGFGKYLKGQAGKLLAGTDVASQLRTDLTIATPGEGGLRLSWSDDVPLGNNATTLTIDAGAGAFVGVYNRTGMQLLETTFIGDPLKVQSGEAFVSFTVRPTLALGVEAQTGALSFGFSAGAEGEWRCYRPFSVLADTRTVGDAWKEVVQDFVVPNTADDLREMRRLPVGTLACVSGHGQLQISAVVNVAAVFNPLVSVNALPKVGSLNVGGAASASVGLTASVSGDYQIRAQKVKDGVVHLGFHTARGRAVDVTLGTSAGPGVSVGDKELLGMLFKGPGGLPTASQEDLVQGGITAMQLDRVTAAMKDGISRKLEVAISAQFSSMRQDEAAFLYAIELDTLDAEGAAAIDRALAGDLTAVTALEPQLPGHGVTVLKSRTEALRKKSVSWRINLVGIVNVLSLSELVRTGAVVHDQESGELVITDTITSDRVGAVIGPKQIRKLLYESTMMTLTYKAAGLDPTGMEASQSFFFFDKSANRQRVSDYLDAVVALRLAEAADVPNLLGSHDDFGKASLLLETSFDQAASERVFLKADGAPNRSDYESIGRRALLALVKASDPDAYRRIPLADTALWLRMKDGGQPSFRFVLPTPITGGPDEHLRVALVAADYTLIVWWAKAMAEAATQLADMRTFLKGRSPSALDTDPQFIKRRRELESAVAKAISRNEAAFDDPWGLVALFMASDGTAGASATLVSQTLTMFLPE